jgi:hypothetical protein
MWLCQKACTIRYLSMHLVRNLLDILVKNKDQFELLQNLLWNTYRHL